MSKKHWKQACISKYFDYETAKIKSLSYVKLTHCYWSYWISKADDDLPYNLIKVYVNKSHVSRGLGLDFDQWNCKNKKYGFHLIAK